MRYYTNDKFIYSENHLPERLRGEVREIDLSEAILLGHSLGFRFRDRDIAIAKACVERGIKFEEWPDCSQDIPQGAEEIALLPYIPFSSHWTGEKDEDWSSWDFRCGMRIEGSHSAVEGQIAVAEFGRLFSKEPEFYGGPSEHITGIFEVAPLSGDLFHPPASEGCPFIEFEGERVRIVRKSERNIKIYHSSEWFQFLRRALSPCQISLWQGYMGSRRNFVYVEGGKLFGKLKGGLSGYRYKYYVI
ncbi:MAG: hypothetical protein QXU75_09560 [Candidatus Methanomethylicaceae archaeon]